MFKEKENGSHDLCEHQLKNYFHALWYCFSVPGFQEVCDTLHTLSENVWSSKDILTKARRLDKTSCSETEDVLFEAMEVSIFVIVWQ